MMRFTRSNFGRRIHIIWFRPFQVYHHWNPVRQYSLSQPSSSFFFLVSTLPLSQTLLYVGTNHFLPWCTLLFTSPSTFGLPIASTAFLNDPSSFLGLKFLLCHKLYDSLCWTIRLPLHVQQYFLPCAHYYVLFVFVAH